MKYFAKYLPVEGEIKKGDKTQSSPTGVVVDVPTDAFARLSNDLKGLKVKLFLCNVYVPFNKHVVCNHLSLSLCFVLLRLLPSNSR